MENKGANRSTKLWPCTATCLVSHGTLDIHLYGSCLYMINIIITIICYFQIYIGHDGTSKTIGDLLDEWCLKIHEIYIWKSKDMEPHFCLVSMDPLGLFQKTYLHSHNTINWLLLYCLCVCICVSVLFTWLLALVSS